MVSLLSACSQRFSRCPPSTSGTVHVTYAHVRQDDEPGATSFYARRLTYPMTVTVYRMLECHEMDLVSLDALSNINDEALQTDTDPREWCLFCIEVRNTYGLPFEVAFDRTQQSKAEILPLKGTRSQY